MDADVHHLLRQLLSGDPAAADRLVRRAGTAGEPLVLVAAALAEPARDDLLPRAMRMATSPHPDDLEEPCTASSPPR